MPTLFHRLPRLSACCALITALLLGACGGGGGGGGGGDSGGGAVPASSSVSSRASSASSNASSRASSAGSVSSTSSRASSASSAASGSLYTETPVVSSCLTGQLKDSERTAVLDKLNAVRARHGLLAVTYDASENGPAAEAALYMVANQLLTHTPSSGNDCYSANAARLAGSSNLHIMWTNASTTQTTASADSVVDYLVDNNVASLGHRRWVLYPFLGKTTYGRVDGERDSATGRRYMASVLKVIGNNVANVSGMSNDFVAYPYGITPADEFDSAWFLSFSVLASKTNANSNGSGQVNFGSATITVSASGGPNLAISEQSTNYDGYGLPNHLQWKVAGLANNTEYTVTIANVLVNGATRQFQYNFRVQ